MSGTFHMMSQALKFVLVPWGANDSGEDIWLLENAIAFGLETIFEKSLPDSAVQFADLYDQLGAELKRTAVVSPYLESELNALASKTPIDIAGIIDGLISVMRDPATRHVLRAEIAPRMFRLPDRSFVVPDAFVFTSFSSSDAAAGALNVVDQERWHALVIHIAEAMLEPFGRWVPSSVGPESLRITPSWAAYCAFLKAKRGTKTLEEKIGLYRQATRHDPDFYWARFNSAQLYKQQEDYHSARREFLAAIKGADGDPGLLGDLYFELGLCSIFLGDTKTARKFWDEALTFAPSNPTLLTNIAGTYEQEEDWNRAMELHQQVLQIDPDNYKALVNVARLKAQLGKIDEAIPLYERALSIHPEDPLRHAILGGCYSSQGDEAMARSYFEKASELDPSGSRVTIHIDEADAPPSPGEYARQELSKLDEEARKRQTKPSNPWRWFGR
jgi:tetratricopeptide (TPR) repeat protein